MKCKYLEQESEIIHKDSKDSNNTIRCEHIHSIQLNNCFKNIQIEQISSFKIKNDSDNLNSYNSKLKLENSETTNIFGPFPKTVKNIGNSSSNESNNETHNMELKKNLCKIKSIYIPIITIPMNTNFFKYRFPKKIALFLTIFNTLNVYRYPLLKYVQKIFIT